MKTYKSINGAHEACPDCGVAPGAEHLETCRGGLHDLVPLMTATEERKARKRANNAIYALTKGYHDGLMIAEIDDVLEANGFGRTEEGIYCGHEGRVHEQVGRNTWLLFRWYRMPSGRYELTAYLSGGGR